MPNVIYKKHFLPETNKIVSEIIVSGEPSNDYLECEPFYNDDSGEVVYIPDLDSGLIQTIKLGSPVHEIIGLPVITNDTLKDLSKMGLLTKSKEFDIDETSHWFADDTYWERMSYKAVYELIYQLTSVGFYTLAEAVDNIGIIQEDFKEYSAKEIVEILGGDTTSKDLYSTALDLMKKEGLQYDNVEHRNGEHTFVLQAV